MNEAPKKKANAWQLLTRIEDIVNDEALPITTTIGKRQGVIPGCIATQTMQLRSWENQHTRPVHGLFDEGRLATAGGSLALIV